MQSLPPGIPFLFRILLRLGTPPVCVLVLVYLLKTYSDIVLPSWVIVLSVLASNPLVVGVSRSRESRRERSAASRLGAVFPPANEGKWPGNIDLLLEIRDSSKYGYPSTTYPEKLRKLGPIHSFNILWTLGYATSDANIVKAIFRTILATDFNNWVKGEVFQGNLRSLLGNGVFNSDGDMWKFHRSMTRPFFSRDKISHFELFDRHSDTTITRLKERLSAGYAVDFQDLISRFTLDSATEFLFGYCVHSLSAPLPYPHNAASPVMSDSELNTEGNVFSDAFSAAQEAVSARGNLGWFWPLKEIFETSTDKYMAIVDKVLDPILQAALQKKEERMLGEKDQEEADDETLLDHLVRFTSDRTVLHDETLNILLAGRDTTMTTLTFAIYLLSLHPDVFKRLRKEVLDQVGPSRMPTFDDVRDMKYLRAVLNETLRLYPAVPWNVRTAVDDTTVPNPDPAGKPIFVPKGTSLAYSVFVMHRRKEYWGPDGKCKRVGQVDDTNHTSTAEEFDPDRFLDYRVKKYLVPNPWIFLPFNGGPRICLGQQFAYNEMSFFLIRLLQNFSSVELDLSAQPPDSRPPARWAQGEGRMVAEKIHPKVYVTMFTKGGLWVKMTEAEATD
ncbi:cytochrome P450 monooxygenase pc-3 [Amylocystis lapponica]|nr:cytochrome P450 monooxygenase pc-3 [Amylocystis lapponica]